MLSILFSTMLFAHSVPHVTTHVTPHVTTVHETAHTTGVHETTGHQTTRPNTKTVSGSKVKTINSSDVNMSRSGYNTSTMWHNWMLFHIFTDNTSQAYQLDVKDKHGKLHTVHLTKEQYDKAIKAKHLLWVNNRIIADGKKIR